MEKYMIWECSECGTHLGKPQDPPCVFKRPDRYAGDARKYNWPHCPLGGKAKWIPKGVGCFSCEPKDDKVWLECNKKED